MSLWPPRPPERARPLILGIDGSYAIFRAFFSIRGMTGEDGNPTGAIYGLVAQVRALITRFAPDGVVIAFDENDTGFRAAIDPEYKANRGETPPELALQWPVARALLGELGLCTIADSSYEADDLLATLAARGHALGADVIISSGDKDLGQVVVDGEPSVQQHDPLKDVLLDAAAVTARWGVAPSAVPQVQALVGDSVDNIRGVRGVGAKTSATLIGRYGSVAELYRRLDEVEPDRVRALLRAGHADAERALALVELVRDATLPFDLDSGLGQIAPSPGAPVAARERCVSLRFRRLAKDLEGIIP